MKKLTILFTLITINIYGLKAQIAWPQNGTSIYYNGGNVGIGINTPIAKLDVRGITSGLHAQFGFGSGSNYITVGNVGSKSYQTQFGYNVLTEKGFIQAIRASKSSYSDLLLNPNGGNVGIGTTIPVTKLQVKVGPNINIGIRDGQSDVLAIQLNAYNDDANLNIPMEFKALKYNFTVGNVGIGTTTPTNKLTLLQSSRGTGPLGTDGTGGVRIAWASGYGVSLDAWDGSHPYWGLVKFSANTPTVVLGGDYQTGNVWFPNGNVGIGTTDPKNKLDVLGVIRCTEVKVEAPWADFVFHPTYQLRTLGEVEQFIKANKHLPEIPTEAEVKENGVGLGEMNAKLLQKVEELTLYLIEMQKRMEDQQKQINAMMGLNPSSNTPATK